MVNGDETALFSGIPGKLICRKEKKIGVVLSLFLSICASPVQCSALQGVADAARTEPDTGSESWFTRNHVMNRLSQEQSKFQPQGHATTTTATMTKTMAPSTPSGPRTWTVPDVCSKAAAVTEDEQGRKLAAKAI